MNYRKLTQGVVLSSLCAISLAACEAGMTTPVSPSAVTGVGGAVNADGTTLKVSVPTAVYPLADATGIPVDLTMTATPSKATYTGSILAHRFQVADNADFTGTLLANDMGSVDAQGLMRFTVSPALPGSKKVYWRVRAESGDAVGPWSNTGVFTTAGATTTVPTTPTTPGSGPRPADPAPGVRLPLPDMFSVLQQFSNASDSCPRGIKYVNDPWQDRVIDAFRQRDTRWGYNAKPTRTAADNGGVPVVAAGDEAAYHYSGGADQGSTEVHLVDMLTGHCGTNPSITWRVFTGEEPGRWTGAGRF